MSKIIEDYSQLPAQKTTGGIKTTYGKKPKRDPSDTPIRYSVSFLRENGSFFEGGDWEKKEKVGEIEEKKEE